MIGNTNLYERKPYEIYTKELLAKKFFIIRSTFGSKNSSNVAPNYRWTPTTPPTPCLCGKFLDLTNSQVRNMTQQSLPHFKTKCRQSRIISQRKPYDLALSFSLFFNPWPVCIFSTKISQSSEKRC